MPVKPQCQPLANDIQALEGQKAALEAGLPAAPPLDRWKALAQIGELNMQILRKQADLDKCQRQNQAMYEAQVVVFDTTNAVPGPRLARLWSMDGGAPAELESAPLAGGMFQFTTDPSGGPIGITIEETGNPAVQGLDLCSGTLDALPRRAPEDPSGRIEIVVGPTLTFTAEELSGLLQTIEFPVQTTGDIAPSLGVGKVDISLASLAVTLALGEVDVVANGTATLSGPMWGSVLAPFRLELPITLGLPQTPDPANGCDVLIKASPRLIAGGPIGGILMAVSQLFFDLAGGRALPVLRKAINRELPSAVAATFGLDKPPRGSVVSLRRFEITPAEVIIQPTISAFGDVLSTFMT
jgi:hypothetical protein